MLSMTATTLPVRTCSATDAVGALGAVVVAAVAGVAFVLATGLALPAFHHHPRISTMSNAAPSTHNHELFFIYEKK
jgi:hypothetical protein